jgi:hypothetical protein
MIACDERYRLLRYGKLEKRKSKKKYAEGGRRLTLGNTHTHTDTQKVEDDGGSLHECDTDGITSADHKEKEEFLYFTHSRNKKKKEKRRFVRLVFCSSSSSELFPVCTYGKRERLCGLGSFPPWIFNLVFLGF